MPPVIHLIALVGSLVCFAFSMLIHKDQPSWNKFIAAGLALLVASMISW